MSAVVAWARMEWKQLRMLRWVGTLFAAALPVLVALAAEAATRGWMPFGRLGTYDGATLMSEVIPGMVVVVWGLLTGLIVAQAFGTERGSTTGWWARSLPIAASERFAARLLASAATIVVIAAASSASVVAGSAVGGPGRIGLSSLLGLAGSLVVLLVFVATLAACAFVRNPMQAFLLGLVLLGFGFGLSSGFAATFPFSDWIPGPPAAAWVPAGLVLGFPLAAWIATCRGEPAGRGGRLRATTVLVAVLVAGFVVFATTGRIAVDRGAERGNSGWNPSPDGRRTVFVDHELGTYWRYDVARAERGGLLGRGALFGVARWNGPGERFGLIRHVTRLGRSVSPRLAVYGGEDLDLLHEVELAPDAAAWDIGGLSGCGDGFVHQYGSIVGKTGPDGTTSWARLVPEAIDRGPAEDAVVFVDGDGKPPAPVDALDIGSLSTVMKCDDRGRVLAAVADPEAVRRHRRSQGEDGTLRTAILRFDPARPEAGVVEIARVATDPAMMSWWSTLSPDGSRLLLMTRDRGTEVLDLRTGALLPLGERRANYGTRWLGDGRLVWADTTDRVVRDLVVWSGPEAVATVPLPPRKGAFYNLSVSPDGRRVLVSSSEIGAGHHTLTGVDVWDSETGAWVDAMPPDAGPLPVCRPAGGVQWVSASHLGTRGCYEIGRPRTWKLPSRGEAGTRTESVALLRGGGTP